jgi:CBS domain-containing protein
VAADSRTEDCMALMSQKKIRHLPVLDGDKVLGMISIRDIMDDIIATHEETIAQLETYIHS